MTFPWKIEVRDANLNRIGELDDYQRLELALRFNEVSTWQLTIDRENRLAVDLAQPGAGVIVSRNGTTVLSGEWDEQQGSKTADSNTLTLSGVDDTDWLRLRDAHPQPGSSAPPYGTTAEDATTGTASSVMQYLASRNIGPDAIVPRRKLTLATDPVYGSTVSGKGRWQNLLTLLQELAVSGTVSGIPVGFRVVQVGSALQFQAYRPVDRTAAAVFSQGLGNLSEFSYRRARPKANYWYVGGAGEGTARTIHEYGNAASIAKWGRREGEFVDARSASTTAELQQAADKANDDTGETNGLSITPLDTERLQFGVHYGLGDRITAVLDALGPGGSNTPGEVIVDVLRECKLSITPDGYTVTPAVGSTGTTANPGASFFPTRTARFIQNLRTRVTNLERR